MKIVFAPDSYGGFLPAPEACERLKSIFRSLDLPVHCHPMADGGEGTLGVMAWHQAREGRPSALLNGFSVIGPYLDPLDVQVLAMGGVLLVESALAIGLVRSGGQRRPLEASSVGLGQLLNAILTRLPDNPVVLGLGGSATVDGGLGMLMALGLQVLDGSGRILPWDAPAAALSDARSVRGAPPFRNHLLTVLVDVDTPYLDAPAVFGPQKGLVPEGVRLMTGAFDRWADVLDAWRQEHGLGVLSRSLPGGAAAGGAAFALHAIGAGVLRPGAPWIARATGLRETLEGADCVILGEGRMDATSFEGKVASTVLNLALQGGIRHRCAVVGDLAGELPLDSLERVEIAGGPPALDTFDAAICRLGRWIGIIEGG